LAVLAVLAAVAVVAVGERRRGRRAQAIRLALAGQMDAAEPLLAGALALDPDDVEVLRAQTLGYVAAGKLDAAERPLERWRALRPDSVEPHLCLTDVSVRRDRLSGAIDGAREALRLRPGAHDLRQRLARWLYLVGRSEEADAECRRCREARPDDPNLALLHADVCCRLGDNARAGQLLDGLLRDRPGLAPALVLRGRLYLDAGQPDRAIPPLRAALAQGGPSGRRARHYLSLALARTGREEEARQLLAELKQEQAVELWQKYGRPDSAAYKLSIAEALLGTGQAAEAVRLLEQVLARSPGCCVAHGLLAKHFEAQGQSAKAALHRRKACD
jgi:predicted Zn-dependent protease